MRPLFSHSSHQKVLVKAIAGRLPRGIRPWLDEYDLKAGQNLGISLREAVKNGTDYFVIFISTEAAASPWVERELLWALEKEKVEGRTLILPVLVPPAIEVWAKEPLRSLQNRIFLTLHSQEEANLNALAEQLADALFGLFEADTERMKAKFAESRPRGSVVTPDLRAGMWRKRLEISEYEWKQLFDGAKSRIWLLGHSMRRSVSFDGTGLAIREALLRGIDVRLIVLDPTDVVGQQIPEIAKRLREPHLREKITDTIRLAWELEGDVASRASYANDSDRRPGFRPHISIGVTDQIIHNSIVLVDDRALVTVYSHQTEMGDEGITIDLDGNDDSERGIARFFEDEFLAHWRRSRPCSTNVRHPVRVDLRVVAQAERVENSYAWYDGKAEALRPPHLVVVFPTLRCKHGARHHSLGEGEHAFDGPGSAKLLCANCMFVPVLNKGEAGQDIDPAALGRLIEELADLGVRLVELSGGGEPFHHRDFPAVLRAIREARKRVSGTTDVGLIANVHALTQCTFREELFESFSYLRWSWPEDAELQPSLRATYLRELARFMELRKSLGSNVIVGGKVLATKRNCASARPQIVPLVDDLMRCGLDHVKVRTIRSRDNNPSEDELHRVADRLLRVELVLDRDGFLPAGKTLEIDLQERRVQSDYRCRVSTLMAVVAPNGDLRMCWNDMQAGSGRVIGNVLEKGFGSVWGSERHRRVCQSMEANEVCNNVFGCHCRMVGYQEAADRVRLNSDIGHQQHQGRPKDRFL